MGRGTRRHSQSSGPCQATRVQAVRESCVAGRRIIRRLPVSLQSSVQCSSTGCLQRAIAHTTSREYVAECAMSHSNIFTVVAINILHLARYMQLCCEGACLESNTCAH